jgi:hypothetical protein
MQSRQPLQPHRSAWHPPGMSSQSGNPQSAAVASRDAWQKLTSSLPAPPRAEDRADLLWQAFDAQFAWYDKAATRGRVAYQILKLMALAASAAVTVLAARSAPAGLTATVAGLIVVLEGVQQLFQFHPNWLCSAAPPRAFASTRSSSSPISLRTTTALPDVTDWPRS